MQDERPRLISPCLKAGVLRHILIKAAALPTELRRRETKIKRTGAKPSGASDLGGREGGRPQLPVMGRKRVETIMRFVEPVRGPG